MVCQAETEPSFGMFTQSGKIIVIETLPVSVPVYIHAPFV